MPRINIPGRGLAKEPVPVEEATSSSTVPSTTQDYIPTNRLDMTTQNHSYTHTISPLSQQANDSNETVNIFLYVFPAIVLIGVIAAIIVYVYVIKRKRRKNETVDVPLTETTVHASEDLNNTQANTSVAPLLNADGTDACSETIDSV